jgi:molecular chaperone GrpE
MVVTMNAGRDFTSRNKGERLAPGPAVQAEEERRAAAAQRGRIADSGAEQQLSEGRSRGAPTTPPSTPRTARQAAAHGPGGSAEPRGREHAAEQGDSAEPDAPPQEPAVAPDESVAVEQEGPRPVAEPPEESTAELRDRWLRAMAELDDQRKRYERRLIEVGARERDRVILGWLPVLDHLELALRHAEADPKSIVAGIEAVHRQTLATLEGLGYHRFAGVGEPFDPARHEAAQALEVPDAEPGTILEVIRPGYAAGGRLLRPAVVTVAKQPE